MRRWRWTCDLLSVGWQIRNQPSRDIVSASVRGRAAIGPHGLFTDSPTGSGRRDDNQEPDEAHRWDQLVALVGVRGGTKHARRLFSTDLVPAYDAESTACKERGLDDAAAYHVPRIDFPRCPPR